MGVTGGADFRGLWRFQQAWIVERFADFAGSDSSGVRVQGIDENVVFVGDDDSLGPAIADTEGSKIFLRGFRGSAASAATSGGSGIGLHMASKIVREMFEGDISVNQVPVSFRYDGADYFQTTFEVRLPSFRPPTLLVIKVDAYSTRLLNKFLNQPSMALAMGSVLHRDDFVVSCREIGLCAQLARPTRGREQQAACFLH